MGRSLVNTNGYLRDSENKYNKINIIPSSNITMEGVDFPIIATPFYKGDAGKEKILSPGSNHNFKGADFVIERKFKKGGEMINRKIIAQEGYNFMKPVNFKDPLLQNNIVGTNRPFSLNDTIDFNAPENKFSYQNLTETDEEENQPYFNPYGDYSMEDAFNVMGSSVENGNALGMLGSAGKIITGGLRNFKSGQGTERENMRRRAEMIEKQNSGLRSYKDAKVLQLGGSRRPLNEIIK